MEYYARILLQYLSKEKKELGVREIRRKYGIPPMTANILLNSLLGEGYISGERKSEDFFVKITGVGKEELEKHRLQEKQGTKGDKNVRK